MIRTACLTITGRVQKVFFRQSVLEVATELGLTGFVMNQADGSVYLEAQGEEAALSGLIAWCRKGPPLSRIDRVDAVYSDRHDRYKRFVIRR